MWQNTEEHLQIISMPLIPFLNFLFSKDVAASMAPSMRPCTPDMYLPSLLIEGVHSESLRFIVGTLSFCTTYLFELKQE